MIENLNIDAEVFQPMKEQFNALLSSLTAILAAHEDGEVNLKLKVKKQGKLEEDENLNELEFEWKITRKIAAKKYDANGRNMKDYAVRIGEDGKPVLVNINEQLSLLEGPSIEDISFEDDGE